MNAPRSEKVVAAWATGTAAVMIAQQVAGKATRDALFLSNLHPTELPKVMIASAVLSILTVLAMSPALSRFGPSRVVPVAYLLSAGLFAAEWLVAPRFPAATAIALYIHIAVFGSIVISGFWSVVSERFDPHAAKRLMGRIAGGAGFGAVAGGLFAERVAAHLDVRAMLLVLWGMNVACALGVFQIGAGPSRASGPAASPLTGLRLLRDVPYLRSLALLALLTSVVAALLDYALRAEAAASVDPAKLFSFFALFYTANAFISFLLQLFLAKLALRHLGLGATIGVHPLSVMVMAIVGGLFPQFVMIVVARSVEFVLANSLFRSAYELLYTPLSPGWKRPTKTIIDVAVYRIGEAVGSGLVLLVLLFFPAFHGGQGAILFVTAAIALTGLVLTRRLHHGYVAQLAESLRSGSLSLQEGFELDATTQRALVQISVANERDKLLAQMAALKGDAPVAIEDLLGTLASAPPQVGGSSVVERVSALLSGSLARIEPVLAATPIDVRLVSLVIPLLGRHDTEAMASEALRSVAPRVVGQLVDALLDPKQPTAVRRKLPRVLGGCEPGRATEGLLAGLDDPRFEVRYQCGQALLVVAMRSKDLVIPKDRVFLVATREVKVGTKVWESQKLIHAEPNEESPLLETVLRDRIDRSLEHVFTLMGLVLDREALQLSLRAFYSGDAALRGTAMEYLENVVPEEMREGLFSCLGVKGPQK